MINLIELKKIALSYFNKTKLLKNIEDKVILIILEMRLIKKEKEVWELNSMLVKNIVSMKEIFKKRNIKLTKSEESR